MRTSMFALGSLIMASCSTAKDTVPQPVPTVASISTQKESLSINNARLNWLGTLQSNSEVTPFYVEVHSISGEHLTTLAQIRPDTDYSLIIKGEKPARYAVKTTSGFTITDASQSQSLYQLGAATELIIPIHTDITPTSSLFMSVVPIHSQGRVLIKEKPKSFLLLAQ